MAGPVAGYVYNTDAGETFMIRQSQEDAVLVGSVQADASLPSGPRGFVPRHYHLLDRTSGATKKLMCPILPLPAPTLPSGFAVVGYTGEKTRGANGFDNVQRQI